MHKKFERIIHKILHILESVIAVLTLLVLIFTLGLEIYRMFTEVGYFSSVENYLQNILMLVVGLEFVRMLVDLTPANTLEVLIVAISRQVIITHNSPVTILVCVLCIAGLFSTRRFLIPRQDMTVELSEVTPEKEPEDVPF